MITELAKQIPATAAVIIVVVVFLKFLKGMMKDHQDFFRDMNNQHLEERRLTRDTMERTNSSMLENMIETKRNTATLQRLTDTIDKKL